MRLKNLFLVLLLLPGYAAAARQVVLSPAARAYQVSPDHYLEYSRPGFWGDIGRIPRDWAAFVGNSFTRENLPWLAAITASTLVLIEYDQKLDTAARRAGRKLNISSEDKTRTFLKVGGVSLFRGPTDLGSALYFLGDGWLPLGLCAGMLTYGWASDDWRASRTGGQLTEGLLVTGITTQLIKRVTGRETPRAATGDGGVWRFFPGFSEFQAHRTRYDAFPSGHLATGVMAITVLSENYPEKKLIKPIGYALMAGLSFQMMNNGVHWASDYPLGIAIGYGVGKAVSSHGSVRRAGKIPPPSLSLYPVLVPGGAGVGAGYRF